MKKVYIGEPEFPTKTLISEINNDGKTKVLLNFYSRSLKDHYVLYDFHESFLDLYKLGHDILINNEKHKVTYIGIVSAENYKGNSLVEKLERNTPLLHFEIMDY
jgi:hypothetical protein